MPTRELVDVFPVEPGVGHGLLGRVDGDAAGPGAAADVFFLLIAQFVEVADAGDGFADIADFVVRDAAAAGEQVFAEFGQIVPIRGGQADPGDDNPVVIRSGGNHVQLPCAASFAASAVGLLVPGRSPPAAGPSGRRLISY